MAVVKTKRLGEILIDAGLVTAEKLDLALREQRHTGEKLGMVLQRLGICSEQEIGKVLARQAGVPIVSLVGLEVDADVLPLVERDFAEQRQVLPLKVRGSTLQVAMGNPLDLGTIDELTRQTGKYIEVVHAPVSEISDALLRSYGAGDAGSAEIALLIDAAQKALRSGVKLNEDDSPFVRLVDRILAMGLTLGATDIHIEPEEKVMRCRYRVDGRLTQGTVLPADLQSIVITRLKILAEMNISETRVPQDGRILFHAGPRAVDLRVSTFPTVQGEGIVCRLLDKENLIVGLGKLGMPDDILLTFSRDITRPHGIVLVTGPTGSGKTTTLYSALTYLNKPDTKIITLEDPVEYELPMINQAQINTAKGFTFAKGLRAILRQDPDIILVGEIRDTETAQLAIRAALTGHLVFSTLHTNSAAGAIPRLLDMGVEPFLLSATLVSVLAQRLVRTVCPECGEPTTLGETDRELLGLTTQDLEGATLRAGKGCRMCHDTGYRGRLAVFEYMHISNELRRLISEGRDATVIEAAAHAAGQRSLRDDAMLKMLAGQTTLPELLRVVS
ncbi:MAG: ATPase, T2SS/T4P/T4SS family [Candidatus Krumholzibacteriia bacterium]